MSMLMAVVRSPEKLGTGHSRQYRLLHTAALLGFSWINSIMFSTGYNFGVPGVKYCNRFCSQRTSAISALDVRVKC